MSDRLHLGTAAANPTEDQYLAALRANPADDRARLAYARWLEQNGQLAQSELLVLLAAIRTMTEEDPRFGAFTVRLRELANRVPAAWRAVVALAPIEGCGFALDFRCPKKWELLQPTGADDVRFCGACRSHVYYTNSVSLAGLRARQGHCVVVDLRDTRWPGDLENPLPPPMGVPAMGG